MGVGNEGLEQLSVHIISTVSPPTNVIPLVITDCASTDGLTGIDNAGEYVYPVDHTETELTNT